MGVLWGLQRTPLGILRVNRQNKLFFLNQVYHENKFCTYMAVDMQLPPFRNIVDSLCSEPDEFL